MSLSREPFLCSKFQNGEVFIRKNGRKQNLFYILFENEKLAGETVIKVEPHVAGSQKLHMKAFHSDGEIIIKRKHVQL